MAEKLPQTPSNTEGKAQKLEATAHATKVEHDATPAEMHASMKDAVDELVLRPDQELSITKQAWFEQLAEKAGVAEERKAAQEALAAQEAPLKAFLEIQSRARKRGKLNSNEEAAEFNAAMKERDRVKKENIKAQLAYVKKLQASAKERIKERYTPEYLEKHAYKAQDIMERYNRLIRVREIVIPAKNQELKIREELLNEKGRNVFQKALKWNADLTKSMEKGAETLVKKTPWGKKMNKEAVERTARITARMARLVGFATAGTAVGLLTTAFAGGPAAAALIAAAGGRVAYGALSTGAGAAAGYGLGKRFEAGKGKQRKDDFRMAQRRNISTAYDLEQQMKQYSLGSDEALHAAKVKRENIGALLTSLSFTEAVSLSDAGIHLGEGVAHLGEKGFHVASDAVHEAAHYLHTLFAGHNPNHAPLPHKMPVRLPPVEHAASIHEASHGPLATSMEIHGRVNNADDLFGSMRDQLQQKVNDLHASGEGLPPALKALFNSGHSHDSLTRTLGFQKDHWSAIMHKGDSLSYSDKTHELIFHKAGDAGPGTTVIDAHGNVNRAGISRLFAHDEHLHTHHAPTHHASHHAPVHHEHHQPVHEDTAEHAATVTHPAPHHAPASTYEAPAPSATESPSAVPEDTNATPLGEYIGSVPPSHGVPEAASHGSDVSTTLGDMVHGEHGALSGANASINIHDISVPLDSSHEYVWKLPGTANEQLMAFGGTPEAASNMAQRFVSTHPGSSMLFVSEKHGLFGLGSVQRTVSAWISDAQGRVQLIPQVLDQQGKPFALPNPDDFINKIDR